jgi:putative ABC transport system substrate-binding protein
MQRRDFLGVLGGAAVAWPLSARAQQPSKVVRIGILSLTSGPSPADEGFQNGLRQLGYVEGQNLVMLYRWAAGRKERLVDLAIELLQLKVDVFASGSTEAIFAIRSVNSAIPIVMTNISDPIGSGLVSSFARPGGNTTGLTMYSSDLAGKRLELLREVVPRLRRVAILVERDHPPTATLVKETEAAAQALQLELQILQVRPDLIADAFRSLSKEKTDGIVIQQTASLNAYIRQIADLAISHQLPTIQETLSFVEAGGLMAYGPNRSALGERAAWYVDRILRGTNPADLPIEQPTKFELALNLKTAKALGLTVPPTLLTRADEVIE